MYCFVRFRIIKHSIMDPSGQKLVINLWKHLITNLYHHWRHWQNTSQMKMGFLANLYLVWNIISLPTGQCVKVLNISIYLVMKIKFLAEFVIIVLIHNRKERYWPGKLTSVDNWRHNRRQYHALRATGYLINQKKRSLSQYEFVWYRYCWW